MQRKQGGIILGSLSTRVFETRTATGREHFACQDSVVSQIFILIISNAVRILDNVNVAVEREVKRENRSLPVAVRVSKTRVLKLHNYEILTMVLRFILKLEVNLTFTEQFLYCVIHSVSSKFRLHFRFSFFERKPYSPR